MLRKGFFFCFVALTGIILALNSDEENLSEIQTLDETNLSLPLPHIVIVGATGVGKSSLANVFIGESPLCSNCTFPVCTEASSCTKETTYACKPWLGQGQNFTVVDTPGFGDTDQDDSVLIDEMMVVLKDSLASANVLYLVLKGTETRLDDSLQQMLREMRALFGDDMWAHVIVGVSFWQYSVAAIEDRNRTCTIGPEYCHNEDWFKQVMMTEIEEKFHLGFDLPFVFIDSWAKHPANVDDLSQQEAFIRETGILWDLTNRMEEFKFKSIQDILDENQDLKAQNAYLKKTLEENITQLLTMVSDNTEDISDLRIKTNQASETLRIHEEHFVTVDGSLSSHTASLDGHEQRLAGHDQQFVDTNAAVQANSAQIAAQGESLQNQINGNLQILIDLGNEFHGHVAEIGGSVGSLSNRVAFVEQTALRQCRVCFLITGPGIDSGECGGYLNGCSGYAKFDNNPPALTDRFVDDTSSADGYCGMQWWIECLTSV